MLGKIIAKYNEYYGVDAYTMCQNHGLFYPIINKCHNVITNATSHTCVNTMDGFVKTIGWFLYTINNP